jgi:predicted dehydrogenase
MKSCVDRRSFLKAVGTMATLSAHPGFGESVRPENPAGPAYRVGVIGHTGRGGFGHGLDSMWLNVPRTTVVGVADAAASAASVQANQKRFSGATFFPDYRRMLEQTRPDLVAICPRYVDQHAEMAVAAARAGVKGVYMEKPFVRTLEEADVVARVCGETGMRLALAHRNRYHPAVPVVSELLAKGTFGKLLELRARGKEDTRGGGLDLWVLGSHVLNLANAIAGKPLACSAGVYFEGRPATRADVQEGAEGLGLLAGDAVHARFEMEKGVPLFFDSIRGAGVAAAGFGLQLICTDAVVDFRVDREPLVHVRMGSPFTPTAESRPWVPLTSAGLGEPERISEMKVQVAGHVLPALDLMEAVEKKRDPLCGLQAGITTVEMIAAVFESHRLGGSRVEIPLKTRVNPWSTDP